MQYKYEKTPIDYSDLASGRVFYSLPGHPAFPVRLASEIFQRCVAQRESIYAVSDPYTLYDPCCGAAYHLSVLGYLHRRHIRKIIASDIDEKAVALANRNLGLLHIAGMEGRINELDTMHKQYKKDSHKDALRSAHFIRSRLIQFGPEHTLVTRTFQSSATDQNSMLRHIGNKSVDIVFTDVPYGQHSQWQGFDGAENPLWSMLDALTKIVSSSSIVAISSDKAQKPSHERYQRIEHFQIGKRRVTILRPT
jgi:16S rRNA G966 N2-methylase RsmD